MSQNWDRPGIIPGLNDKEPFKRPSSIRANANVFAYVKDAFEQKSPPGLGRKECYAKSNMCISEECGSSLPTSPDKLSLCSNAHTIHIDSDKLMLRNGTILNKEHYVQADIMIENGKICSIGRNLYFPEDVTSLDAVNLYIYPGAIDYFGGCVVLGQPSAGDTRDKHLAHLRERAFKAAKDGVTTFVDTIISDRRKSSTATIKTWIKSIHDTSLPINVLTRIFFTEIDENIPTIIEHSIKNNMGSSFMFVLSEEDHISFKKNKIDQTPLHKALVQCRNHSVIPIICICPLNCLIIDEKTHENTESKHSEHLKAVVAIAVAKASGCPIVISPVREASTIAMISAARQDNPPAVCYANLWTSDFADMSKLEELIPFIAAGNLIIISSGNMFTSEGLTENKIEDKNWISEAWKKIERSHLINRNHFTEAISFYPAQLLGLWPDKGNLSIGAQADLVLWASDHTYPLCSIVAGKFAAVSEPMSQRHECTMNGKSILQGNFKPFLFNMLTLHKKMSEFIYESNNEKDHQIIEKLHLTDQNNIYVNQCEENIFESDSNVLTTLQTTEPGRRNLHLSSFKLNGSQMDDGLPNRPGIRICKNLKDSARPF